MLGTAWGVKGLDVHAHEVVHAVAALGKEASQRMVSGRADSHAGRQAAPTGPDMPSR